MNAALHKEAPERSRPFPHVRTQQGGPSMQHAGTLHLDLQPPERWDIYFCCWKTPESVVFVWQPNGTKGGSQGAPGRAASERRLMCLSEVAQQLAGVARGSQNCTALSYALLAARLPHGPHGPELSTFSTAARLCRSPHQVKSEVILSRAWLSFHLSHLRLT